MALTREKYGDRCPLGYEKYDLLAKSGTSLTWLGMKQMTGAQIALKQYPNGSNGELVKKEIEFSAIVRQND